jgi:hypothetical protein
MSKIFHSCQWRFMFPVSRGTARMLRRMSSHHLPMCQVHLIAQCLCFENQNVETECLRSLARNYKALWIGLESLRRLPCQILLVNHDTKAVPVLMWCVWGRCTTVLHVTTGRPSLLGGHLWKWDAMNRNVFNE